MTNGNGRFKAALELKRQELKYNIRAQAALMEIGHDEKDLVDQVQSLASRDEAGVMVDRLTRTLSSVNAALEAMSEGTYGICADCGEEISLKRLASIPWAPLCIHCQEALEHSETLHTSAARLAFDYRSLAA